MNKKNLFVIALTFVLALSMSMVAFAEEVEPPVNPGDDPIPYQYATYAKAFCSVSGGTATCRTKVTGSAGVTKIVATQTLQRKSGGSWSNLQTWSPDTVYGSTFNVSHTKSVSSGYYYRTKATVTVYKGAASETFTVYSGTVNY